MSVPRRVRRLKLITALSLLGATTLALTTFGVLVAGAAHRIVHDRVGTLLTHQVSAGLGQVEVGPEGEIVVGFADDPHLARGYPELYVVADGQVVWSPEFPLWPEVDVTTPAAHVLDGDPPGPVQMSAEVPGTPAEGRSSQVAILADSVAAADGSVAAVVVGVADKGSGEAAYQRLVAAIRWAAAGMVAIGLVVALLLARGRFWLVDRAITAHERFLHDTAHELRGPLATMSAIADAGLSGQRPPERALAEMAAVLRETDEVIDDLVALTRIEIGRDTLETRPVRLDLLVEEVIRRRADDPPVVMSGEPTVVTAQPNLVRRAVVNLVDNAVRHGRSRDPEAEVHVTVADGSVTVADRGPGVSSELLAHFTERVRAGQRADGSGSGLGLATAGWVGAVHGGGLEATNRARGGARFTLRLPGS